MCGEHFIISARGLGKTGSSPHVRGALRPSATIGLGCGIIPACAGSTLFCHRFFGRFRDHPRMCGEHLPESAICGHSRGSSPHVRGAQNLLPIMQDLDGIIPACAGSTCARLSARLEHGDHPRMCGEHYGDSDFVTELEGSSPHVRGARFIKSATQDAVGIIPACAGSTVPAGRISPSCRDHPRMCGEHTPFIFASCSPMGSSPHVRGARTPPSPASRTSWDHPRMCGEHFWLIVCRVPFPGSSPHVRGAHHRRKVPAPRPGIIPACAGSTRHKVNQSNQVRDHPRMCGEHSTSSKPPLVVSGSSPHVRGAPFSPTNAGGFIGIIPACAGSTLRK